MAVEAEAGTLTKGAIAVADTAASGSKAVKFAAGTTVSPPTGVRNLNCAPAASATMTNNVSSQCSFPDVTNSGVPVADV